jgi:hypothetical protein
VGIFMRILLLAILLGGLVVGVILVGQTQLINKQAADISSSLSNLRPSQAVSPTPGPDAGSILFTSRFQGLSSSGLNKSVSLSLKQGEAEIYTYSNIAVSSKVGGNYSGQVQGINPGAYDFYLRADGYLIRKFSGITVETGENKLDFTSKILTAGDFDANNKINVTDIGILSAKITSPAMPVDGSNSVFDLDGNGTIGSSDMDLLLSNYKGLEISGE